MRLSEIKAEFDKLTPFQRTAFRRFIRQYSPQALARARTLKEPPATKAKTKR